MIQKQKVPCSLNCGKNFRRRSVHTHEKYCKASAGPEVDQEGEGMVELLDREEKKE